MKRGVFYIVADMDNDLLREVLQALLRLEDQISMINKRLDGIEIVQDVIADDLDAKKLSEADDCLSDAPDLLGDFLRRRLD